MNHSVYVPDPSVLPRNPDWNNLAAFQPLTVNLNSLLIKSQVEIQEIIQIDFGYNK